MSCDASRSSRCPDETQGVKVYGAVAQERLALGNGEHPLYETNTIYAEQERSTGAASSFFHPQLHSKTRLTVTD